MINYRWRGAATALAAVVMLAGCGTTVSGHARAGAPTTRATQQQGSKLDPCALLTPKQSSALGLVRNGKPLEANLDNRVPHGCSWDYADPESDGGSLTVTATTKLSLAEWVGGQPPNDQFELGGLAWKRFPSIFGESNCTLGVELGENSFVGLMSSNLDDPSKACELAKKAAPLVAAHLPGGNPNPTLPTPTTTRAPPSPLVEMEPCALLTQEQLEKLGVSPEGHKTSREPDSELGPGCEWEQTANKDLRLLYATFNLDEPAEEWTSESEPTGEFVTGGRTWRVYYPYLDNEKSCMLILPVTKTSAVEITGGNNAEPEKACVQLKEAAEMMTPKIPKG